MKEKIVFSEYCDTVKHYCIYLLQTYNTEAESLYQPNTSIGLLKQLLTIAIERRVLSKNQKKAL